MYQRIKPSTGEHVGAPGPLPAEFAGFGDETLANLGETLKPCPDAWADVGFLYEADPAPVLTASYTSKVLFERRFTDAEFAAFDRIRLTIRARPADWSTTTTTSPMGASWTALEPFVRAFSDYDQADQVNILDPDFAQVLAGLQSTFQVFGSDAQAAQARIATVLAA